MSFEFASPSYPKGINPSMAVEANTHLNANSHALLRFVAQNAPNSMHLLKFPLTASVDIRDIAIT
jgi:hypothetical protein